MIKDKELSKILNTLIGRRFRTIEDICNAITVNKGIWKANLVEEELEQIIGDYSLIGQVGIADDIIKLEYDIQLFFIRDNQNNYYITETMVLEELI